MTKWLLIIILALLTLLVVTCGRTSILKNELEKEKQDKNDFKQLYNTQSDSGIIWRTESKEWRNKAQVLEIEARNKKEVKEVIRYIEKFPEIKNNGKNLESIHDIGVEATITNPCPDYEIDFDTAKNEGAIYLSKEQYEALKKKQKEIIKTPCENIKYENGKIEIQGNLMISGYEDREKTTFFKKAINKKGKNRFHIIKIPPKLRYVDINSGPCFKINYNKKIEFKKK